MKLTLTQPSFSGALILMAMSNLLLWEHVTSSPDSRLATESLYIRLIELSHYTYNLASNVFNDFNMKFGRNIWQQYQRVKTCHTAFIMTPANSEEVHKATSEDLLQQAIGILQAWEEPLKLMEAAVVALPDSSDGMLAKTKELRETTVSLVMGLKTILRRTQPGAIEDKFSFRSGWLDLKSPDDNTRNLALYTLARCLRRDTHRIDNYLKVLKCRDVLKNNC